MPSANKDYLKEARKQVSNAPTAIVQAMASQLEICDISRQRIKDEGTVVRDLKGSVVPHPGIKIELDAIKTIADLCKKYPLVSSCHKPAPAIAQQPHSLPRPHTPAAVPTAAAPAPSLADKLKKRLNS